MKAFRDFTNMHRITNKNYYQRVCLLYLFLMYQVTLMQVHVFRCPIVPGYSTINMYLCNNNNQTSQLCWIHMQVNLGWGTSQFILHTHFQNPHSSLKLLPKSFFFYIKKPHFYDLMHQTNVLSTNCQCLYLPTIIVNDRPHSNLMQLASEKKKTQIKYQLGLWGIQHSISDNLINEIHDAGGDKNRSEMKNSL